MEPRQDKSKDKAWGDFFDKEKTKQLSDNLNAIINEYVNKREANKAKRGIGKFYELGHAKDVDEAIEQLKTVLSRLGESIENPKNDQLRLFADLMFKIATIAAREQSSKHFKDMCGSLLVSCGKSLTKDGKFNLNQIIHNKETGVLRDTRKAEPGFSSTASTSSSKANYYTDIDSAYQQNEPTDKQKALGVTAEIQGFAVKYMEDALSRATPRPRPRGPK
ncbi:MAG: hypothetical protein A3F12_03305 [Gammaproteobacteria bacterium RIFCSPHIGHO2_12_FULL_38_14]|nr:MAG: hypothetical protein A3F12_03305 [Gammaproteobacteria bacterium RIFCSPHIGHO2_12_FULL_38_14]